MKDSHPLLVLSPRVFNERTGIVIGLPMTPEFFNESNPFAVKFIGPENQAATYSAFNPNHSIGANGTPARNRGSGFPRMYLPGLVTP